MNKIKQLLSNIGRSVLSYFPTKLPDSRETLEVWLGEVLRITGYADTKAVRAVVCTDIMHLDSDARPTHKSKRFFAKGIQAQMIRQQVFDYIEDFRNEEKAKRQAEAEATGNPVASSPKTPMVN